MAKLPRKFQILFGRDGDQAHFGEFGSRRAGTPLTTKDPSVIQALSAFFTNGWLDAINAANKAPFLEDMNGLFFLLFYQICNLFQDGIPAWDPSTTYYIGSVVRKDGTNEMYSSLTNDNTNNALPNQTANGFWTYMNPQSVAAGVISDFGGSVAPFGYLLCDGSSYATASYPALFAAIGYTWGGAGANFNVPDLRGRATIGAGTGSGLTPRILGTSLGEENHTLVVAEIPPGLTVSDPGHLHSMNVTGSNGVVAVQQSGPNEGISGGGPGGGSFRVHTTVSASTGITVGGGGAPHNNMQPVAVVTKIIKT